MAEKETNTNAKSDNNMKFAVTLIIVLVTLLALAVFVLQQKKNDSTTAPSTEGGAVENTRSESQTTKDAGALGKNEVKLTDSNFKAEIEDYKGVALVDFYLPTCPYCQNVAEKVTAASDELAGKVKVGKLDAKANSEVSSRYNIESVPTFVVFKDGKEVERAMGEKTKEQLLDIVNKNLK